MVWSAPWHVTIHTHGRSGVIEYREGEHTLDVSWEFGGSVVAILDARVRDWDAKFPWAAGRSVEILERIGAEVVRQKAPSCVAEIDPANPDLLYIRDPADAPGA